jgi:hypothetical protein
MRNPEKIAASTQKLFAWKRLSIAALAATTVLSGFATQIPAIANASESSQYQQQWQANLNMARLQGTKKLVLQLDVQDKPLTSYANVVYLIYARRSGQWAHIHTSTGARLVSSAAGRIVLAPEVVDCKEIEQRLGWDLDDAELKVVAQLRYDVRGDRDRQVQFEQVRQYRAIAKTTTTQLVSFDGSGFLQPIIRNQDNNTSMPGYTVQRGQGRFSLAILQKQSRLKDVVARISLKERVSGGFRTEQLIGDFRYKLDKKQKSRFIQGLTAGDRVVVRLFTRDNRLIGYSEFEVLAFNSAVALILPEKSEDYGIVRTVYGIDRDEDFSIDRSVQIYDYFTQVTRARDYRQAEVTFFSSVQTLNLSRFDLPGLPQPRPTCTYPTAFATGSFSLVNQVFRVFASNLVSALTVLPGQRVQIINVSTTNISVFQVNQLIVNVRQERRNQDVVTVGDDDDDRRDRRGGDDDNDRKRRKTRKRSCNQGIGNGAEGCDPGRSRPHGGSNDEDDDD